MPLLKLQLRNWGGGGGGGGGEGGVGGGKLECLERSFPFLPPVD